MLFEKQNWKQLKPREASYLEHDDAMRGLACQVSPRGTCSWVLKYSPERYKQVQVTLGSCEEMTITVARTTAQKIKLGLEKPPASKKRPRLSPKPPQVLKFAELVQIFMDTYPHQSTSEKKNKRVNCKRIVAKFGKLRADEITPELVREWLDEIVAEGHASTANACQRTLSRIFTWGKLRHPGMKNNPCDGQESTPVKSRKVRLYADDLKILGKAIKSSILPEKWGIPLLLLLGGRLRALELINSKGRWDADKSRVEFDENEDGLKGYKYGYISPEALWCWQQLPKKLSPQRLRQAWEEIRVDAGFGLSVRRHDFRHTFRGAGHDAGVDSIHLELLMGHKLGGMVEKYHESAPEVLLAATCKASKALWGLLGLPKVPSQPVSKTKKTSRK